MERKKSKNIMGKNVGKKIINIFTSQWSSMFSKFKGKNLEN
jgi:hypothetical protein